MNGYIFEVSYGPPNCSQGYRQSSLFVGFYAISQFWEIVKLWWWRRGFYDLVYYAGIAAATSGKCKVRITCYRLNRSTRDGKDTFAVSHGAPLKSEERAADAGTDARGTANRWRGSSSSSGDARELAGARERAARRWPMERTESLLKTYIRGINGTSPQLA